MKNLVPRAQKVEYGVLYKTDGAVVDVVPGNGRRFSLEELQKYVGGDVERVICAVRFNCAYVNEEGALRNLPPNPHTWTVLKREVYALNGYAAGWRVSGNILMVGKKAVQP